MKIDIKSCSLLKLKNLTRDVWDLRFFILLFLGFLALYIFSLFKLDNYLYPKAELILLVVVTLLGTFCITYYSKRKGQLHRVALVVILSFGLVSVFLTPLLDVLDEREHFTRAEMTSRGVIFPEYDYSTGTYQTIKSVEDMHNRHSYPHLTVFNTDFDSRKIDDNPGQLKSAFVQNPFFGYLAPAVGIKVAKLLDLNAVWMLWLGRLFNLILYALVSAYAIKKSPIFKMQLMAVACLPLAIYYAASTSIDAMINSFALLVIGYFFYMYKSADYSLDWRHLLVFFTLCLVCGFCKVTYMALSLLVLVVPLSRFRLKRYYLAGGLGIVGLLLLTISWTSYVLPLSYNSWRGNSYLLRGVNSTQQVNYMLSNPAQTGVMFLNFINYIPLKFLQIFDFSLTRSVYSSTYLSFFYSIYFAVLTFLYPGYTWIKTRGRLGALVVVGVVFYGTYLVQYLSWEPVGAATVVGVFTHYLVPLLALLPFVFSLNKEKILVKDMDIWVMTLMVGFIAGMMMLTLVNCY